MNATALLRKRAQVDVRSELALRGVTKVHGKGEGAVVALDEVSVIAALGLVHDDHGTVGIGQEHVPACRRGPRQARPRAPSCSATPS